MKISIKSKDLTVEEKRLFLDVIRKMDIKRRRAGMPRLRYKVDFREKSKKIAAHMNAHA